MDPSTTPEAWANAHYVQSVMEYLQAHGHDAEVVFGRQWVQTWRGAQPRSRMDFAQWEWTLKQAVQHLQDPALPMKMAKFVKPRHLGMLGFLLMSCDTLGQAALTLQRYEGLLDSVNRAHWEPTPDGVILQWLPLIPRPAPELMLLALSLWVTQARWLTEREDLVCAASFTTPEPSCPAVRAVYVQTFGPELAFNQPVSQIRFDTSYVTLPLAQRDRQVHELLRAQAEADLAALMGQNQSFVVQLQDLLKARLGSGQIALQDVADALGLAPRTLQHRLDEHGLSYRQLLDTVRCQAAKQHLGDARLALSEIALMLGFADQSSFHHAFKRWTGMSPGAFRHSAFAV